MSKSILVWISVFIAFALHIAIFSSLTIVFPINPDSLKPKFFFLGSILGERDVQLNPEPADIHIVSSDAQKGGILDSEMKSLSARNVDRPDNPFSINSVPKPLISQEEKFQDKQNMKSTFEISLDEEGPIEEKQKEAEEFNLGIESYKPLQFRKP